MKILLLSQVYAPSVGGIETVSYLLAREFTAAGHEVRVVTQTPLSEPGDAESPPVIRRPTPTQLLQSACWCDIFFQNNISLQTAWPVLLVRRPWLVTHQTWIGDPAGRLPLTRQERLKRRALRSAQPISVGISQAIADHLPAPPTAVIGNPYDDAVFRVMKEAPERTGELIFVGRLVADKGCDLLIEALSRLNREQVTCPPRLTVVGDGPEKNNLIRLAQQLGLANQVQFIGVRKGEELVRLLNSHSIAVVPSRWAEPFGLVALEAIACGCVVVVSNGGGLPDAGGPCCLSFPNGDIAALADRLAYLISTPQAIAELRVKAQEHLDRHSATAVANAYLGVFHDALSSRSGRRRQEKGVRPCS